MGLIALHEPTINIGVGIPNVAAPGTGTAVPTGIESIYRYNDLTLNDKTVLDKYRIMRIEGLADPDVRDQRETNPSRHGETALSSLYGGRTITLTGRVEGGTLEKLRDMVMALKMAFMPLVDSPLLVVTGKGYARDHQIICRKTAPISLTEEQQNFNFYRDFMITLRAADPRILSRERITTSTVFSAPTATGETIMTLTNIGSFPAQPLIVLRGPMTGPQLAVAGWEEGAPLKMSSNLAPGEERWIDIASRRIYDEFGTLRFAEYVLGSTWLELPSGSSLVSFAATGLSSESSVTFYHRHSWL